MVKTKVHRTNVIKSIEAIKTVYCNQRFEFDSFLSHFTLNSSKNQQMRHQHWLSYNFELSAYHVSTSICHRNKEWNELNYIRTKCCVGFGSGDKRKSEARFVRKCFFFFIFLWKRESSSSSSTSISTTTVASSSQFH